MSKLSQVLRDGSETLDSLSSKYAIKIKEHPSYPGLFQFKYDQISSPMENPLVQEARGIILNHRDSWEVVARPFDKFFNLGEPNAAPINWDTARVLEKLDGSLMIVYWHDSQWHVATSGTPDAGGPVGNAVSTAWRLAESFQQLFWQVWYDCGYDVQTLNPNYTYMFELMTPENRVVVRYPGDRLVLIGVRHTFSGEEINIVNPNSYEQFDVPLHYNFEVVQFYSASSLTETQQILEQVDGTQREGFVVVDSNFNRIKIKHPRYVRFHQAVGGFSTKFIVDAVRSGETPEILAYFPELQSNFNAIQAKYSDLLTACVCEYVQIKDIENQKDFAIEALKTRHSNAHFSIRKRKYPTFTEYFKHLHLDTLVGLLDPTPTEDRAYEH